MTRNGVSLVAAVLLTGCLGAGPSQPTSEVPGQLADGWPVGTPQSAGLDPALLARMVEAIEGGEYTNVHAVLIERDGRLVYERYFTGEDERWGDSLGRVRFGPETLHDVRSVGKSVTSALVGVAFSDRPEDLGRSILDLVPERAAKASPGMRAVTPRHLLTMTAGWQWDESMPYWAAGNSEREFNHAPDSLHYLFSRRMAAAPGTQWTYSGGATELLAELVSRRTGQPFEAYAQSALFAPLGITQFEWLGREGKPVAAASGLRLRPRDMLKFGSMYRNEGRWNGRQIVPATWVQESFRRHVDLPDFQDWDMGYGYQWWEGRSGLHAAAGVVHAAIGKGEQRIYIVPALRMTIAITAGSYEQETRKPAGMLLGDWILPATKPL